MYDPAAIVNYLIDLAERHGKPLTPMAQAAGDANYCHSPKIERDWQQPLLRHEGDRDFTDLYQYRRALCADVDAGGLKLNQAIDRSEAERQRVIEERLECLREGDGKSTAAG